MSLLLKRRAQLAVLCILCLLCVPATSAPYFNKSHEFIQPDNSVVSLILNGDEFYMQAETEDGYTVVRDPQTGWICYAELSEDGSKLISTGIPIGNDSDISTLSDSLSLDKQKTDKASKKQLKKKLKINTESRIKKVKQKQKLLFGEDVEMINGLPYPAGTTATTSYEGQTIESFQTIEAAPGTLPSTKDTSNFSRTLKGLVLVFDFSDAPASYTLQQYDDKVNKVNSYYSNGNAASLRTYYEDVSRGVFIMDHFVYGIFRAPETFEYYDSLNYAEGARQLMSIGLNQMEADGFDFSQLTTNSSGEIQALAVMYTGNPHAWSEGMWYHASGWGGFSADGVHTGPYCTDSANNLSPGTLIHEHGHMAAKWPDTYSYVGGEPGTWGVMGGGYCDLPNPYFLYENGWLDGENIMDIPGLKTMDSTDPHFAYFYYDPDQPTEFYMMRPYTNNLLYCPDIPDQGMTFWRINTQGDNAQYPNSDRHIELVHANNVDTIKNTNVCFKQGGLLDYFTPFTTPGTDWKFGAKSGLPSWMDITGISAAGAAMTFTLNIPPDFAVSPTSSLDFTIAYEGTTNDASAFTVNNNGVHTINWTAETGEANWYDLSVYSGTISSLGSYTVTVTLNAETQNLPVGTHEDTIVFTNTTDNIIVERTVTIQVYPKQKIAYWPLDETAGTTASDISSNRHDGTVVNTDFGSASVTGQVGTALQFDGSNDHIVVPGFTENISGLTLSAWIKADDWNGNRRILQKGGDGNEYRLLVENGQFVFEMGSTRLQLASLPATSTWVHIVAVYDGSTMSIYYNKVLKGSIARTGMVPTSSSDLYIGTKNAGAPAGDRFKGAMDEVRLYNHAKDAAGIQDLYNGIDTAEALNPYDGAGDVLLVTDLQWSMASGAVSNDVYFGTDYNRVLNAATGSNEYQGRQGNTAFALNTLKRHAEYFWRIDQIDDSGNITQGPVWRFSTGNGCGAITRQVWNDISGNAVTDLTNNADYPDNPDLTEIITSFEGPTNWAENYGSRLYGFLIPPATGSYTFWIASDDYSELWLSTDENPDNRVKIAYAYGATGSQEWNKYASQESNSITLTAGKPYYIMALHKEGAVGDNIAVAFSGPSINQEVIPGDYLMPFAPDYDWGPAFIDGSLYGVDALEGYTYQDSVAGTATAMDGSDVSYSKAAGPLWLQVASDGTLSGIPGDQDVGSNNFDIRATDAEGNTGEAPLYIHIENTFTGELGLDDFVELAAHWMNQNCEDLLCNGADLTGDGNVEMADLESMASMWLTEKPYGLLIHWPFDVDSVDTTESYNGVLMNGAAITQTNEQFILGGGALSLDGIDDYVEIPDYKGVTGTGSRTCYAWVNTTTASGEILSWGEDYNGGRWVIRVNEGGQLRAEVQGGNIIGTTLINDGNWHHVAVVLRDDGSPDIQEARLYVDGQRETISASVDEWVNTGEAENVMIGVYFGANNPRYFQGLIDDVRIYDRPLTQQEIQTFALLNLHLHLKLNETTETIATDASVYQRNGNLLNGPTWQPSENLNGAIQFDGIDDYIEITNYKGITGTASRTCCAWINTTTASGEILSWGEDYYGGRWVIRVNEGGQLRAEVQGGNIIGDTLINDGNWHHIAVVVENDGTPDIQEARLYVDGQRETISASVDEPINSGEVENVLIGAYLGANNPRWFQGLVDDVRIYDQPLTQEEIQAMVQ